MLSTDAANEYTVACEKYSAELNAHRLETSWKVLEKEATPAFFLSWHWVGVWLRYCVTEADVIEVKLRGRVVGLALVASNRHRRHGFLSFEGIHLNHTGDEQRDQIWPEYSGILVAANHEVAVYSRVIQYLDSCYKQWDEFYSGVMDIVHLENFLNCGKAFGLWSRSYWKAKGYLVDLERVRQSEQDYVGILSKNTRSQIRRTFTQLEKKGYVEFREAKTMDEALELLAAIAELHKKKWGVQSGFNNPTFVAFHRGLVKDNFHLGVIQLFGIYVDGILLAGLYNFVYANQVLFYLSGVVNEKDNRLKIGLALHAVCIQRHLEAGRVNYDFMGGEMRYKQSLSNTVYDLEIAVLEKPVLKIRMEHFARRAKHSLLKWLK